MEEKSRKIYHTMGEVTEMLDVKPSLIRHWEKNFPTLKPHKNKKGNRLFTPADVETLKLIYHLVKEKGMTLAGAGKALKKGRGEVSRDTELMDRLLTVRSLLEEIRQELKDVEGDPTSIVIEPAPEPATPKAAPAITEVAAEPVVVAPGPAPEPEPETAPAEAAPAQPELEFVPAAGPAAQPEPGQKPLFVQQSLF